MRRFAFSAGATILQQGDLPDDDDHLYVLMEGDAEVVITGAVESKKGAGEGVGAVIWLQLVCPEVCGLTLLRRYRDDAVV